MTQCCVDLNVPLATSVTSYKFSYVDWVRICRSIPLRVSKYTLRNGNVMECVVRWHLGDRWAELRCGIIYEKHITSLKVMGWTVYFSLTIMLNYVFFKLSTLNVWSKLHTESSSTLLSTYTKAGVGASVYRQPFFCFLNCTQPWLQEGSLVCHIGPIF